MSTLALKPPAEPTAPRVLKGLLNRSPPSVADRPLSANNGQSGPGDPASAAGGYATGPPPLATGR